MDISVVIPVYGCRAALPELHRRLTETLSAMTDSYGKYLFLTEDGKVFCANEDGYPTEDYYPEPNW